MIRNSFVFLEGIGLIKEISIWRQGITGWDVFLKTKNVKGISSRAKHYYDRQIFKARRSLHEYNSGYFFDRLGLSEHWRLYEYFKEDAIYLDIETDGVNEHDDISVIGLYDGINTKTMVRGLNLDYESLKQELLKYKILVTFNGSVFDLPYIKKRYGKILPMIPHLDLRFSCRRAGLSGKLKEIEKRIGIKRENPLIENFYSGDPARLHRMWRGSGDKHYLQLLVEYNESDVVSLKKIAEYVYGKLKVKMQNLS